MPGELDDNGDLIPRRPIAGTESYSLDRLVWEEWHDERGYDYCEACDDYGHLAGDCPD